MDFHIFYISFLVAAFLLVLLSSLQIFIFHFLDVFVHVRFISLCFHSLVLYVHVCCIIVTWCGEPNEIKSCLGNHFPSVL